MSRLKFILFILAGCLLLQILKANKMNMENVEKIVKKTKVDKKVFMAWETDKFVRNLGGIKKKIYEKCNELSIKKGWASDRWGEFFGEAVATRDKLELLKKWIEKSVIPGKTKLNYKFTFSETLPDWDKSLKDLDKKYKWVL